MRSCSAWSLIDFLQAAMIGNRSVRTIEGPQTRAGYMTFCQWESAWPAFRENPRFRLKSRHCPEWNQHENRFSRRPAVRIQDLQGLDFRDDAGGGAPRPPSLRLRAAPHGAGAGRG